MAQDNGADVEDEDDEAEEITGGKKKADYPFHSKALKPEGVVPKNNEE